MSDARRDWRVSQHLHIQKNEGMTEGGVRKKSETERGER